jgi:splicing factor U2AF subunit
MGEVEDMIVCENIVDHLVGNVYIKFTTEEYAERCFVSLQNMQYENRPLMMEYSPVIDFTNAKCKQFIEGTCQR